MSIVDRFKAAGLELEVADTPLRDVGNSDVFQMDVAVRGRRKGSAGREVFRIWPGHPDNRLEVVGLDRGEQQLVLMVHEPSRPMVHRERIRGRLNGRDPSELLPTSPKTELVSATDDTIVFRQWTADQKRHYLCGVDERQLFIAQLPGGHSTVRDAHDALKPETLAAAAHGSALRQGEWFFVEASAAELDMIRENSLLIQKKAPVGRGGGRPHVADEAISLEGGRRYVRGAVRHPDHRTLHLPAWHRVHLNRESRGSSSPSTSGLLLPSGILWID